ncbi:pectate lyase-like protein [Maribacter vaceletii]|uniref:Pectate lyase-like protein n=1 Tax=Maribacter vaceletii TaxID=1206816 RepID=A0A495EC07_9FLAO|nr:glycosyl hydrolase family 28 protein [Maribacter vaceletii]RKR14356.1 pectate lyase-like protein [Maribacter vaceletii]
MKKTTILLFTLLISISCSKKNSWNINEFGAKADGKTVNTEAIQKAIDACSEEGGGIVTIEGGTYISGTILLKDNVNLHVSENAILLASVNPNDFYSIDPFIDATGQYRGQCFIGAADVENISITGKGTIDGQGKMFTPNNAKKTLKKLGLKEKKEDVTSLIAKDNQYVSKNIRYSNRPFLVRLVRVTNSKLKDITLRQPAAWTLHFFQCNTFEVDGIKIFSKANKNNDGIDIDSSTDGIIKNSLINSDDDAICFKSTSLLPSKDIVVKDCRISSGWGAIKFGTESQGNFENITVKDCHIFDTRGGGIKILSADGANASNILIDNIDMVNVEMPIFIRLCERRLTYRGAEQQPVGSINNVKISNINAVSRKIEDLRMFPTVGFYFSGTPNHKLGTITLENIDITLPGGGTEEHAKVIVPENEKEYPEFTKLGITPAYGMYARHISNLITKNISFKTTSDDARKEVITINVDNL